MRTKRQVTRIRKVHLHPLQGRQFCPICGHATKKQYYTGKKKVRTLKGVLLVYYWIYSCENHHCKAFKQTFRHPLINLKHKEFGNDVYAFVGFLRFTKKKTYAKIRNELTQQGMEIGQFDSSIKNITETYLQLINAKPLTTVPESTRQAMRKEGIVLAVDGIQPEKGNAVLYLIIDVKTGELLYARKIDDSDTEHLKKFLQVINDLELPVLGIISDKQPALVKALGKLWPDVPHQFCQFHFLRNLAKTVTEDDSSMRKRLKMHLRGIKQIRDASRSAVNNGSLSKKDATHVQTLYKTLRTLCRRRGCYPFRLAGLTLYEALLKVKVKLKDFLASNSYSLATALTKALNKYHDLLTVALNKEKSCYKRIKRQYSYIHTVKELLNPDQPQDSVTVRKKVEGFWRGLKAQAPLEDCVFIQKGQKMINNWSRGLYCCYDHSLLPHTNNALEQRIKQLKYGLRKISGRHYTHDQLIRYGYLFAFAMDLDYEAALSTITQVDYESYFQAQQEFEAQQEKFREDYRIKKDLSRFLDTLLSKVVRDE